MLFFPHLFFNLSCTTLVDLIYLVTMNKHIRYSNGEVSLFPPISPVQNTTIILCLFLLLTHTTLSQRSKPEMTELHGHTLYTVLKPGDIPAIFDPQYITTEIADSFYYQEEPLLVVVSGNEIKAYSTWHLDEHEVVNDYIGGTAITVTW